MRSIILAAGMGKRLGSAEHDLPKVMHLANGRPLLDIALETVGFIDKKDIYIVVGYKKEVVMDYFGPEYNYCVQKAQRGTGDAVRSASEDFSGYDGDVIITFGDMPLFRRESVQALIEQHRRSGADCTIMSGISESIKTYGRIIRDGNGDFLRIVEARDCTPEEYAVTEVNSGVAVYKSKSLFGVLPDLDNNNAQGEYYLTDVPSLMKGRGMKVGLYTIFDGDELLGVNTPEELAAVEKILQNRSVSV